MKKPPAKSHPWRNSPLMPSRRTLGLADVDSCKFDAKATELKRHPNSVRKFHRRET